MRLPTHPHVSLAHLLPSVLGNTHLSLLFTLWEPKHGLDWSISMTGLIVGIIIGLLLLFVIIAALVVLSRRKAAVQKRALEAKL